MLMILPISEPQFDFKNSQAPYCVMSYSQNLCLITFKTVINGPKIYFDALAQCSTVMLFIKTLPAIYKLMLRTYLKSFLWYFVEGGRINEVSIIRPAAWLCCVSWARIRAATIQLTETSVVVAFAAIAVILRIRDTHKIPRSFLKKGTSITNLTKKQCNRMIFDI